MSAPLDWEREGRRWPHREASRFVAAAGLDWHVQQMGTSPCILLLHGTGASTHSWRGVMPELAGGFCAIAPDLPGHAFTGGAKAKDQSLQGMAAAVAALLATMDVKPAMVVGHSAGAAVALQMVLDGHLSVPVVGFAPALLPFEGPGEQLAPAMAKLLFANPFVPKLFSGFARLSGQTRGFLDRATGSSIDAQGLACYETLFGNSDHARGALAMMAGWDLAGLKERLGAVDVPVLLVAANGDKAVPARAVKDAGRAIGGAQVVEVSGGHLFHEEKPVEAARMVADFAARVGVGS